MTSDSRSAAVETLDEALDYCRGQVDYWANALETHKSAFADTYAAGERISRELHTAETDRIDFEDAIRVLGYPVLPRKELSHE